MARLRIKFRNQAHNRKIQTLSLVGLSLILSCSNQASLSKKFLAAEQMWNSKNYSAAVSEFDQIVKEDPSSTLGLQSLLRASFTRTLFLKQHDTALKGLKTYLEKAGSSEAVPRVEMEIGEIYFNRLHEYEAAIQHYQRLLSSKEKFQPNEKFVFQYRIARANFLLGNLKTSISEYETALSMATDNVEKAKVYLDMGSAWYSFGDQEKNGHQNAIQSLNRVLALVPKNHPHAIEAEFWIAASLEELDQLEDAFQRFTKLLPRYPAPNVVRIKILRLEERLKRKRK